MLKSVYKIFLVSLIILNITGCSSNLFRMYQMDIEQGNHITKELIKELKPNMAKKDVQKIMGTAVLINIMHPNRLDYYYSIIPGDNSPKQEKTLSIFFKNGLLSHVDGDQELVSMFNNSHST